MIKIVLNGANGKMGRELLEIIGNNPDKYQLVGSIISDTPLELRSQMIKNCDIVIDFSTPEGTGQLLNLMNIDDACALLIGTTGLGRVHIEKFKNLSQHKRVLYTENTSVSANIVAYYSGKIAETLVDYDVEIIEAHHKYKKDAPSGTALMIGHEIAKVRKQRLLEHAVFSRYNHDARQDGEIGFSSIRGGGVTGEHKVIFLGDHELVSLECRSFSRKLFADGAFVAANWLMGQKNGFYSMQDVLNLKN
jgi:4-hydroxy-tetrahydrodipicolinate reductase